MAETGTREWIRQVTEEHRELDQMVAELRDFLERPRPEAGRPGAHSWSADLSARLVALHDRLFRHFRYEEEGGMVEQLSTRHPRATRRVEEIVDEHPRMLRTVRRLMSDVLTYSEGREVERSALRGRVLDLLDHLKRHEQAETDLIQSLEYEELGIGD